MEFRDRKNSLDFKLKIYSNVRLEFILENKIYLKNRSSLIPTHLQFNFQLGTMIGQSDLSNWDHIFATSTKWFDAVITLRKLPAAREKIMKEKEIRKNLNRLEVPDWDLGHVLISQLEQSYGHLAIFFSQESSARLIGIKFKKQKVISAL